MGFGTLVSAGSLSNVGSIAIGVGMCVAEIVSRVASLVATGIFGMVSVVFGIVLAVFVGIGVELGVG